MIKVPKRPKKMLSEKEKTREQLDRRMERLVFGPSRPVTAVCSALQDLSVKIKCNGNRNIPVLRQIESPCSCFLICWSFIILNPVPLWNYRIVMRIRNGGVKCLFEVKKKRLYFLANCFIFIMCLLDGPLKMGYVLKKIPNALWLCTHDRALWLKHSRTGYIMCQATSWCVAVYFSLLHFSIFLSTDKN